MKRGARSQNNRAGVTEGLDTFLPELLLEVFSNLPPKSFMGENDVRLVCHQWQSLIDKNTHDFPKKNKESMLKTSKSKRDRLAILRDKISRESLSFEELIALISDNDELSNLVIKKLDREDLERLANFNAKIALFLYTTTNQTRTTRFNWATKHIELARILAQDGVYKLSPRELAALCSHDEIFDKVKQDPELIVHSLIAYLPSLIQHSSYIAVNLLAMPKIVELIKQLNLSDIFANPNNFIACISKHEIACHAFLDNEVLLCHASENPALLLQLGIEHVSVAKRILSNELLTPKLTTEHKLMLCISHFELAQRYYSLPEFQERYMNNECFLFEEIPNYILALKWLGIVKRMRTDSKMTIKLNKEELATLENKGTGTLEFDVIAINNDIFADFSFDYMTITNCISHLINKGDAGLDLIIQILNSPESYKALSSTDCHRLIEHSIKTGMVILQNPDLYAKLEPHKFSAFNQNAVYAKEGLRLHRQDFLKLDGFQLHQLCSRFPCMYDKVMNDPELKENLQVFFKEMPAEERTRFDAQNTLYQDIIMAVHDQWLELEHNHDTISERVKKRQRKITQ